MDLHDIIMSLLSRYWLEIAAVVGGTLLVYVQMMPFSVGSLESLPDESIPESFRGVLAKYEPQLLSLGFRPVATLKTIVPNGGLAVLRMYEMPDHVDEAMVVECIGAPPGTTAVRAVEFGTRLSPHGNIDTTNWKSGPRTFAYPHDNVKVRMPWLGDDVAGLLDYHRALCQEAFAAGFRPLGVPNHDWRERLLRQDCEVQVARGRMKRLLGDRYRMTIWGAIGAVPLQVLYMLHPSTFGNRHKNLDQLRKMVRKRFLKAQTMPEHLRTCHRGRGSF